MDERVICFQLCGDRNNPSISVSDIAYCIPANPMSDRGQSVCYEVQMNAIDIIEMSHDLFSTKFGEDGKENTLAATDYKEPLVVCYSIGSMNSKGMLSSNPRAGIHRTDVSRTIDANGSNPAGYQGGDVIVQRNDISC